MVRQRILDADTHRLREVLTYMEDWEGFDFMGKEIPAVRSHWEGIWYEQNLEPITDHDSNMVTGYRSIAPTTRYYIDFKPKTVQELIEKSSTPDPELIKYIVQSIGGERTGYANYDQFVNLTWQQCADILLTTGGFESAHIREIVQHTK